jgi:hypothetical protein
MNERMKEMDGWMDERMKEMDGWMDEWIDGWMYE